MTQNDDNSVQKLQTIAAVIAVGMILVAAVVITWIFVVGGC